MSQMMTDDEVGQARQRVKTWPRSQFFAGATSLAEILALMIAKARQDGLDEPAVADAVEDFLRVGMPFRDDVKQAEVLLRKLGYIVVSDRLKQLTRYLTLKPPRKWPHYSHSSLAGIALVTRLHRLARSTRDLLNILHEVGERAAAFKSLADAWADTTTPHGKLMVTILGGLAEFERSLIKARTGIGIKHAREAGIKFGRPLKLTRHQQQQAIKLLDQGEPQSVVARLLNVDQSTISRLVARELIAAA